MARRFLANRFLRKQNLPQHAVEQHVEWCVRAFATSQTAITLFALCSRLTECTALQVVRV